MICSHCGTECIGSVPACVHDALKAKLATATVAIQRIDRALEENDHLPYVRIHIAETLRALGIDPSKEQDARTRELLQKEAQPCLPK